MSPPGSLTWFARHEGRLAWREMMSMMTAGRRDRERKVALAVAVFLTVIHIVAYYAIGPVAGAALGANLPTLVGITTALILAGSAILSQAMEGVTRTFYARADLELVLSSPARLNRFFAVRIGAIALSICAMSLLFIGPFINVLAVLGSPRWLSAYGVLLSVALVATAVAIVLTVLLFQIVGPKRTRLIAQITAAVIGGAFVIGLQISAMFSTGTLSRLAFLQSVYVLSSVPSVESVLWWPARAALGDAWLMLGGIVASVAIFVAVTMIYAPRFARYAIAASGIAHGSVRETNAAPRRFRVASASATLRRKERLLLIRDPWLMSQSLMQLLYLLPPALLLWHNYGAESGAAIVAVPVLVMAAGQVAGGLAWLAISGEDAPDLVLTAPIRRSHILRAKVEAVLECIAVVFGPFVVALAFYSLGVAIVAFCGITASSVSATLIQSWFRKATRRANFQRRHTSSRIATFAEALSSISWAGAGAVAATGNWIAIVPILMALGILAGVRSLAPARSA